MAVVVVVVVVVDREVVVGRREDREVGGRRVDMLVVGRQEVVERRLEERVSKRGCRWMMCLEGDWEVPGERRTGRR